VRGKHPVIDAHPSLDVLGLLSYRNSRHENLKPYVNREQVWFERKLKMFNRKLKMLEGRQKMLEPKSNCFERKPKTLERRV